MHSKYMYMYVSGVHNWYYGLKTNSFDSFIVLALFLMCPRIVKRMSGQVATTGAPIYVMCNVECPVVHVHVNVHVHVAKQHSSVVFNLCFT